MNTAEALAANCLAHLSQKVLYLGKVGDANSHGKGLLCMMASSRISAFDVIVLKAGAYEIRFGETLTDAAGSLASAPDKLGCGLHAH